MGLASVPTWIRPYNVLSNGEQYRASLAKVVSESKGDEIIYVDEYTSVVDRNVAKAMSNALQKYIRKTNKRIILATCHYDVFDWLRPDWIYDLNKGGVLERGDYLRRPRPQIELQVFRTTCDTWQRFKKYHYMTSELNEAAMCFVFVWDNKVVAFVGVLPFPSGTVKNAFREHRLVVLPDYQGMGIGSKVSEFVGGILKNKESVYYTKTVNPALGLYRANSNKWQATPRNMQEMKQKCIDCNMMGGLQRPSYCYKYIGEKISGYDELLLSSEKIRNNKRMKFQLTFDF
jgi:GNAT superfamily N-acetyltransferase